MSGFLTGSAGTGKSSLLRVIVDTLRQKKLKVLVTATTGNAAVLLSAVTVHSALKLFPNESAKERDEWIRLATARAQSTSYYRKMLQSMDSLIIDEASMLCPDTLDVIDAQLRIARERSSPFGGLQVILVGDLCQLPPISKGVPRFLFDSNAFWQGMQTKWELVEVFRQNDPVFCALLQRMRFAENTADDIKLLESRIHAEYTSAIIPTRLFAKNMGVDIVNTSELAALTTPMTSMESVTGVTVTVRSPSAAQLALLESQRDKILGDLNMPPSLSLRIGAQVMLSYNLDVSAGYVNGSRGIVVGFKRGDDMTREMLLKEAERTAYPAWDLPVVEFDNGKKMHVPYVRCGREVPGLGEAFAWHCPLRLAWATSIHRSQGQSLQCVRISLDDVFETGQAYVAVSRATSIEGLFFTSFSAGAIRAHPRIKHFYKTPFSVQRAEFALTLPPPEKH